MNYKRIFDEFLGKHSNEFKKNEIELSSGKGRESIGGSLYILINSNDELIIRLKKITGKKVFGGLKWVWNDQSFKNTKQVEFRVSDFIVSNQDKELFNKLSEIQNLIDIQKGEILKKHTTGKISGIIYSDIISEKIEEIIYENKLEIIKINIEEVGKGKFSNEKLNGINIYILQKFS